jgi:dihydroorotate dehydrogenase (fumarate)
MISEIQQLRSRINDHASSHARIAIEVNMSCPNIEGSLPPSYTPSKLASIVEVLAEHYRKDLTLTLGLKLPPYVHSGQFTDVVQTVASFAFTVDGQERNPIAFLSCTNTLGSSVVFKDQLIKGEDSKYCDALGDSFLDGPFGLPAISGGLGGESIHALAVGNVHAFSKLLARSEHPSVRAIRVIGIGGVASPAAVKRMCEGGAVAVACATYLGRVGVRAFELLST